MHTSRSRELALPEEANLLPRSSEPCKASLATIWNLLSWSFQIRPYRQDRCLDGGRPFSSEGWGPACGTCPVGGPWGGRWGTEAIKTPERSLLGRCVVAHLRGEGGWRVSRAAGAQDEGRRVRCEEQVEVECRRHLFGGELGRSIPFSATAEPCEWGRPGGGALSGWATGPGLPQALPHPSPCPGADHTPLCLCFLICEMGAIKTTSSGARRWSARGRAPCEEVAALSTHF